MRRREFLQLFTGAIVAWPLAAHAEGPAKGVRRHQLSLSSAHRAAIWRSLGKDAMKTQIPAGLNVGEAVPATMHLLPFDRRLRKTIPSIRRYSYALLQGQVLIIDPGTKKIVAIVGQ